MTGGRGVAAYFGLVTLLTLPLWIAGSLIDARLLPGLPVAALAIVVPAVSAILVAAAGEGWTGVRKLFGVLARPGHRIGFVASAALAVPLVGALLPWLLAAPGQRTLADPATIVGLVPIFLISAIAEEIGWTAFATERLQGGLGLTGTALVVGVAWALWHLPALVEVGRPVDWIAWWAAWTVAQRVVMTHLYGLGGGWFWGPVIFHASSNVAWQAAPDAFLPMVEALVMTAFALLAVLTLRTVIATTARRKGARQ